MTDFGTSIWQLDEASGSTAVDGNGIRNGTYFDKVGTTGFPNIVRRVEAPPSEFGAGFKSYFTGDPYYSGSAVLSPGFSVATTDGGYGNMYSLQPFTLQFKVSRLGFLADTTRPYYGAHIYDGGGYVSCFHTLTDHSGSGWSVTFQQIPGEKDGDFGFVFTRGSTYLGGFSTLKSTISLAMNLDTVEHEDWDGVYTEPIKIPTWHVIAVRYDGTAKSIWQDGIKVAEDSVPDNKPIADFASSIIFSGNCNMANVALFHHALTDGELGP